MSEYGPALFLSRKDNAELGDEEQSRLLNSVQEISKSLNLVDEDQEPVSPEFYDYGEYEERAVSFSLYSSSAYAFMPEEIQEDTGKEFEKEVSKIFEQLETLFPNIYSFKTYFVEL